jgi:hypothetical protein
VREEKFFNKNKLESIPSPVPNCFLKCESHERKRTNERAKEELENQQQASCIKIDSNMRIRAMWRRKFQGGRESTQSIEM